MLIFTGITWRSVILSAFCFCWLKMLLMLACCWVLSWCNNVYLMFTLLQSLFFWLLTSFKIRNSPSNSACPCKANTLVFLCYLQVLMALLFCHYCFAGYLCWWSWDALYLMHSMLSGFGLALLLEELKFQPMGWIDPWLVFPASLQMKGSLCCLLGCNHGLL